MRESKGNARLLVVVDGTGRPCDRALLDDSVFAALSHMGLPFAVLDIAARPLTPDDACECAALILAQENLAARLDDSACDAIARAVARGVGVISFDYALRNARKQILSLLKLEPEDYPVCSDVLTVSDASHFITSRRTAGQRLQAGRGVPVQAIAAMGREWHTLLSAVLGRDQLIATRHLVPGLSLEPAHLPALCVRETGAGRLVQFLTSPRLWRQDFLGHASGVDDVFYRSIVWAARKPFAAKPVPPFVTARIDDCSGAHDFRYADALHAHGYIPSIACFWDRLDERAWRIVREKHAQGVARFQTHALSYYELMYFNFGKGELPESDLRARFEKEDDLMRRHGIELPRTAHAHWNAMGVNALPFLKARGRSFVENPCRLGEIKCERTHVAVHPYGSNRLGYDFLEEDPDIFRFFGQFNAAGAGTADFLEGDVLTWLDQSPFNNVDKAVARGVSQIRAGLDSLYFGQLITHEQKLSVMTLHEIERVLKGIDGGLAKQKRIFRPLDDIAAYLREHRQSTIASTQVTDGTLQYRLAGPGHVGQVVTRYEEDDEGTPETA